MQAMDVIKRMHEHRAFVNRQLLAAAKSLALGQLSRPFPIGQGSVWKSLLHLYAAEYVWLGALEGDPESTLPGDVSGELPGNQQDEGGIKSLEELTHKWEALERRWSIHLERLVSEDLAKTVWKISTSSGAGKQLGTSVGDVLIHVCTHAQYTTAQVINMLRHAGHKPLPETMLITLARQEFPGNRDQP